MINVVVCRSHDVFIDDKRMIMIIEVFLCDNECDVKEMNLSLKPAQNTNAKLSFHYGIKLLSYGFSRLIFSSCKQNVSKHKHRINYVSFRLILLYLIKDNDRTRHHQLTQPCMCCQVCLEVVLVELSKLISSLNQCLSLTNNAHFCKHVMLRKQYL